MVSEAVIDEVAAAQAVHFAEHATKIDPGSNGLAEWADAAERSPKRHELKYPLGPPYTNADFAANRIVLAFVKSQLGRQIEIDTFSSVTSQPGAPTQPWHADVPMLFPRKSVGPVEKIPPFGVVTVMPLVDVTAASGPTEFVTGSHVNLKLDYFINNPDATPHTKFSCRRGSAILFDMRIRHRGGANKSSRNRAISYTNFTKDWYSDRVNFKDRQTRGFDALPTVSYKKLFAKLDREAYTRKLEEIVEKHHLADLQALKSTGGYKQQTLIA